MQSRHGISRVGGGRVVTNSPPKYVLSYRTQVSSKPLQLDSVPVNNSNGNNDKHGKNPLSLFWGITMNIEIVIMKLSFNIYWSVFFILVHYFPPPTLIHTWPRSPPLRVLTTSGERHDLRNTFFPSQFPFWEKTILWPLTGNGLPDPEKILDFPSKLSLWCLRIPTLKHHHW